MQPGKYQRRVLPRLIVLMYVLSFFLPAIQADSHSSTILGSQCFAAALYYLHPVWLANLWLWLGFVFLTQRHWFKASVLGLAALLFGMLILRGTPVAVGYWLWLASMALLTLAGVLGLRHEVLAMKQRSK